jgi:peptidoglycan/xylan/chitin deacetylase (PgdA/CDA1 family)/GT2 family glycosyltransferase
VFFDPSGRRWRRAKRWLLGFVALVAALFVVSWRPIQAPPAMAGKGRLAPLPTLGPVDSPPMIGVGPLVRLVRIENRHGRAVAVDPLAGARVGGLTAAQRRAVGTSRYALYRYGYDRGLHKTILLTFDDGPDPAWTPPILDLLSHNGIPATFFVIGSEAVQHPELVNREVREGHAIGNHTMTHPELTMSTVDREIVTTDRILTATAGVRTNLFRPPYSGDDPAGSDGSGGPVLAAQRLGYLVAIQDFDTNDWEYGDARTRPSQPIPLPPTTMDNITILLHDGGGNRAETLAYLRRLIPWAKAHGYTFRSMPQASAPVTAGTSVRAPNLWDREVLWSYQLRFVVAEQLLRLLFGFAVLSVVVGGVLNVLLAIAHTIGGRGRGGERGPGGGRGPVVPVSVVVAAFNESAVIGQCLASVCRSRYRGLGEVVVVDDGSTDETAEIVEALAARDDRVRLVRQPNRGKPAALNRAFAEAGGEVVVTLDADTLFTPTTVHRLVEGFARDIGGRLGAVAGHVKVGNLGNPLTRWQALEYIMQVGVDRSAQDALHAIMVVPGACAAWRREAVVHAGGFSAATLAEDCDLALQLQRLGYRVEQRVRAEAFTEAPESFRQLSRQRFRWTFGNAQALWKHRSMILNPRFGWLGLLSLPSAALAIVMPVLFLPFVYLMAAVAISQHNGALLLLYALVFIAVQLLQAVAGVVLTRERPVHLLILPVYRLIAEPLRAYLLYKSALMMLRGTRSRWHKVARTGSIVREPVSMEVRP